MIEPQSVVEGRKVLYLASVDGIRPPDRDWKTIAAVLLMAGIFFALGVSVGVTAARRERMQRGDVQR